MALWVLVFVCLGMERVCRFCPSFHWGRIYFFVFLFCFLNKIMLESQTATFWDCDMLLCMQTKTFTSCHHWSRSTCAKRNLSILLCSNPSKQSWCTVPGWNWRRFSLLSKHNSTNIAVIHATHFIVSSTIRVILKDIFIRRYLAVRRVKQMEICSWAVITTLFPE